MLFVIRLFGSLIFQNGNRRLNWSGMGGWRQRMQQHTTELWIRFNDFNGCSMWNRDFLRTDAKRHDLLFFVVFFMWIKDVVPLNCERKLTLGFEHGSLMWGTGWRWRWWGWCFSAHPQPMPLIQSRWQFYSIHSEFWNVCSREWCTPFIGTDPNHDTPPPFFHTMESNFFLLNTNLLKMFHSMPTVSNWTNYHRCCVGSAPGSLWRAPPSGHRRRNTPPTNARIDHFSTRFSRTYPWSFGMPPFDHIMVRWCARFSSRDRQASALSPPGPFAMVRTDASLSIWRRPCGHRCGCWRTSSFCSHASHGNIVRIECRWSDRCGKCPR